jgi:hypothetical protein
MCCNKAKTQFSVTMDDGTTKVVASEQEARTLVRIKGGSYTPKAK